MKNWIRGGENGDTWCMLKWVVKLVVLPFRVVVGHGSWVLVVVTVWWGWCGCKRVRYVLGKLFFFYVLDYVKWEIIGL